MGRLAVTIFTLLAIASLVAKAADESTEGPRQIPPPQRVGEAYQAYPPPLASLKNILGPKPSLNDLDLYVSSFAQIVFETEKPRQNPRYPWIMKWAEHLDIFFEGDVELRHKKLLERVSGDLFDITGLPISPARFNGNLRITITDDFGELPYCYLLVPHIHDDGSLYVYDMVVSPLLRGDQLLECFYEDISQALGAGNDLALTEVSMYRSETENGQWPSPTWHDVIMLRTLYDRRIKPGMHEDQAMPLVREIIAELLQELNAPKD